MATFPVGMASRFFYKCTNSSRQLPQITFLKIPKTSNSRDTDLWLFPLLFSFKLAHFNQSSQAEGRGIPRCVDTKFHPLCIFPICQVVQDPFLKSWLSSCTQDLVQIVCMHKLGPWTALGALFDFWPFFYLL